MKKFLSVCLSVLLLLLMVPLGALSSVAADEMPESVVVNVKDFGAVGDGKTDDRNAIMETFHFALLEYLQYNIPVTVYFPEGQYGLLYGGMYVYLPRGYGNLTVKGDGADKSTLVYLDEWDNNGSWVALRILPKITPESEDRYLHDITIQDLGVYDTDPEKHAWHVNKGDPSSEETHGFNIQYCVRATIKNCQTVDVGDECFDMSHCIDSVMTDNLVVKNRITGNGGGSLSVGDGSRNVTITNNRVVFDADSDSVSHYGIAVEALSERVEDIYITDNTVENINGWGVNIGAPKGTVSDVLVQNNTLTNCHEGGVRLMGTGRTEDTEILGNYISKVRTGVLLDGSNKMDTLIDRCTIEDVSYYAVNVKSPGHRNTVVQNVTIRNARWRAIYNGGTNTLVDRVFIDGSGTAGGVTDSAIIQYASGGDCTISNLVLLNCQNKKGIQGVNKVINSYIQQPELSGYTSFNGCGWIENCRVNRMVTVKSGCTIDGLVLYTEADLGSHAIVLSNLTDCTVKNCVLTMSSRYGISEAGTANNNVITNNVCVGGSGVKTVGADTVATGNVRATLAKTEQFAYRVVEGQATVMAPLDTTLTALTIPATIEDCPVTAIDPWAFARCESLTSVSIPDTLTTVGSHAFACCPALTTVNYGGLESQRESITVGAENSALTEAVWTYHWENHNYDNACDSTCNDCAFTREVGDHVYTAACDPDCNECGFFREAEAHTYDNVCDAECNACGSLRTVPAHTYDAVVTAPDCENGGYTTYICSVCGYSCVTDETEALGHSYNAVVTAPDCENGGYTTYTCSACGDSYVTDEVEALGHSYNAVVTAPDCENGGYTTYTCTVCGDSYVSDEVEALGHAYYNACDAECNTCGAVREVPDHVYDNDKDADCNECGAVREVSIPGDVTGDGKVTNRDLAKIQQYITGWIADIDEAAADVDGNGKVTNRDLAKIQQYITGWITEL